jgi:hypothetical protein
MRYIALVILVACGSDSFTCTIGELAGGTWRLAYVETNGTCGPIPDETYNTSTPGGGQDCSIAARTISADKCHLETAFTCLTTDGAGIYSWTIVLDQTAPDRLEGTGTVQLQHPAGTCRGTYDLNMRKL